MLRLSISFACLSLLVTACASTPDVYVNQDPAADFGSYRTYAFETPLGTDLEGGSQSILSSFLKSAVSRELDARGYRSSDEPDLLVNVNVLAADKVRVEQSPSASMGYYGYRHGRYGAWGGYSYETHVDTYTEGTLTIDVIEVRRNQLIWEGTLIGRVTQKVRDNLQATVDDVVREIFTRYPVAVATQGTPAR